MEPRKKILSLFLLSTYLLVVGHQSIFHTHDSGFASDASPKHSHQHEDFKDVHHEHHFHVGIFHFLGHLFETINHANDNADNHLVVIQSTITKKAPEHKNLTSTFYNTGNLLIIAIDAESLPDPPYYQVPFLQELNRATSPLRAPPSLV